MSSAIINTILGGGSAANALLPNERTTGAAAAFRTSRRVMDDALITGSSWNSFESIVLENCGNSERSVKPESVSVSGSKSDSDSDCDTDSDTDIAELQDRG
jgi:hypothetical protein